MNLIHIVQTAALHLQEVIYTQKVVYTEEVIYTQVHV